MSRGKLKLDFECADLPLRLLTSQWQQGEKCLTYVSYRWFIAIFYTFTFINSVAFSVSKNTFVYMFIFLTRWNLFGTMVAMVLGAILATQYYKSSTASDIKKWQMKFYWFLSNISVVFSLCISTVYWTLLYKEEDANLNNWLVHATNSIFLVTDLLIVQHPPRFSHLLYPMAGGSIYMLFSLVYPMLGGKDPKGQNYVYPILDWKNKTPMAIAVGLGTVVLAGIFHVAVAAVHLIREAIHHHFMKAARNDQTLPCLNRIEKN